MDGGELSDQLLRSDSWLVLLGVAGGSILVYASYWLVGIAVEEESSLDSGWGPEEFGIQASTG